MYKKRIEHVLMGFGAILVLTACSLIPNQPAEAAEYTVAITFKGGRIVVEPNEIRASPGDIITWYSNVPFHLRLKEGTPFTTRGVTGWDFSNQKSWSISAPVMMEAPLGAYKYNIRVQQGDSIWVEDPWIIIIPR